MIDRITKNEERLDSVLKVVKELKIALENFKENQKNIKLVSKYYGSKNWFKDKEYYEQGKISKIKAGVLSEDTVWNMLEDIKELTREMQIIINNQNNNYILN